MTDGSILHEIEEIRRMISDARAELRAASRLLSVFVEAQDAQVARIEASISRVEVTLSTMREGSATRFDELRTLLERRRDAAQKVSETIIKTAQGNT